MSVFPFPNTEILLILEDELFVELYTTSSFTDAFCLSGAALVPFAQLTVNPFRTLFNVCAPDRTRGQILGNTSAGTQIRLNNLGATEHTAPAKIAEIQ